MPLVVGVWGFRVYLLWGFGVFGSRVWVFSDLGGFMV